VACPRRRGLDAPQRRARRLAARRPDHCPLAAARLGFKCHVFSPSPDSPAFDVVQRVSCADYSNTEALDRFAADVDVITYEFENVPAETATFLAARVPVPETMTARSMRSISLSGGLAMAGTGAGARRR